MSQTHPSYDVDYKTKRRVISTLSHLLGDRLVTDTTLPTGREALADLETAFQQVEDLHLEVQANIDTSVAEFLFDEIYPEITVHIDDRKQTLESAGNSDEKIEDVELVGGRPAGLESYWTAVTDESDGETISDDFTIIEQIGQERADILADSGYLKWDEIAKAERSDLESVPQIGKATAGDLQAEANTHIENASQFAIESYNRVQAIPTDEDGCGISRELDDIKRPPGDSLDPEVHGDFNGWHYLEDIDHPEVPDYADELKTRTLPNGDTDIETVCKVLKAGKHPLLIGPPGVGKNEILKTAFGKTNRPLLELPLSEDTMTKDIMGIHTVNEDGVVLFDDGPVPRAVKYGWGLCFDEPNAASSGVLKALHKILEDDPKLYVKGKNEVIEPHPEFYAALTINPHAHGTSPMSNPLTSRTVPIHIGRLDVTDEVDLLDQRVNDSRQVVSREELEGLVQTANNIRDQSQEGFAPYLTFRDLESIITLADGADLVGATKMIVQGKQEATISGQGMGGVDEDALDDLIRVS